MDITFISDTGCFHWLVSPVLSLHQPAAADGQSVQTYYHQPAIVSTHFRSATVTTDAIVHQQRYLLTPDCPPHITTTSTVLWLNHKGKLLVCQCFTHDLGSLFSLSRLMFMYWELETIDTNLQSMPVAPGVEDWQMGRWDSHTSSRLRWLRFLYEY